MLAGREKGTPNGTPTTSRRRFLAGVGSASGAAALGFPAVARGQLTPVALRWQSTWPAKDLMHELALDFAAKVNDMAGGELKIDVLPAGAMVPASELLDAVSKGALDGGHGMLSRHIDKEAAFLLWGSGPAFSMDAKTMLAWHRYGGGKEFLARIYESIGANVVSFLYAPMPTQPLGWFKKPVAKLADLADLRFRVMGVRTDFLVGAGPVDPISPKDFFREMNEGLFDVAGARNSTTDLLLGLPDAFKVCMLQSYHRNAEQLEILFNKTKFAALPPKLRAIIENAVDAASTEAEHKMLDRNSKAYIELQRAYQVKFYKTTDAVLNKQLEVFDQMAEGVASANPLFREIMLSQKAFANRTMKWQSDHVVSTRMAISHYFARK